MTKMRDVRVAIDASWLRDGGIARMAHEIISRKPANVSVIEIRNSSRNAGLLTPADLALQARAVQADVIWSPGFMPPIVRIPGKRMCITIHDLAHLHHYSAAHRLYYNLFIRNMLANVDLVFTVSDYTRQEILRWAAIGEKRVRRIYNGVSDAFREPKLASIGDGRVPYILYAGNRRSYKNISRLIAAFAHSGLAARGFELWLTGARDDESSQNAAQAGIAGQVRYLGRLSDDELATAYGNARALAFISLYEGFGLPVVEAMSCGCPVLTSNTTALAEVAGNAALTVDPLSIEAIADGLNRICLDDDLRDRLRVAGFERAAHFTWDQCAAQYWQMLVGT